MSTKTWQEFTIKMPSKRDGKEVEFTLEQLFNDVELGNALAEDLQLTYEKRLEAFNWLKTNVKQFISDLRKHDEEELIKMLSDKYNGTDVFIQGKLEELIKQYYAK